MSANPSGKGVSRVQLEERKLKILSAIVESYVETGEPVSSRTVCNLLDFPVSSATVRNEMSVLSDLGYLEQPHTSAGRIPTHKGYRLYINKLMNKKPISLEEKEFIKRSLYSSADDPEHLIEEASQILADITNFTAVLTTPPGDESRIRDIQFVQTGRRNAMMVLMTSTGMVKNRLFRCDYDINPEILEIFRKMLNDKFKGQLLTDVTPEFLSLVDTTKNDMFIMMDPVISAIMESAREACKAEIKMDGQTNLLTIPELDLKNVLSILSFLDSRENVLDLMLSGSKGVKVFIGEESEFPELEDSSVIVTRYKVGDRSGAIGVIGPTRMDYAKLVTRIEYIASVIGTILGKMLDLE